MQFMVSLVTDGSMAERMGPEQMRKMGERMGAFMGELQGAGALVHTGRLAPAADARTLRYGEEGRPVVTDGPFAETKEQIAGYMILECRDLDEAMDWVQKMPVAGGSLEVRPIAEEAGRDG